MSKTWSTSALHLAYARCNFSFFIKFLRASIYTKRNAQNFINKQKYVERKRQVKASSRLGLALTYIFSPLRKDFQNLSLIGIDLKVLNQHRDIRVLKVKIKRIEKHNEKNKSELKTIL